MRPGPAGGNSCPQDLYKPLGKGLSDRAASMRPQKPKNQLPESCNISCSLYFFTLTWACFSGSSEIELPLRLKISKRFSHVSS
jgi:hypothetical protein